MKILHLEDNSGDAALVREVLIEEWPHCELVLAKNRETFLRGLQAAPDVVLADFTLETFDGLEALRLTRMNDGDLPFIFLSGTIAEHRAIEAVHAGAQDYILKDHPGRLVTAIRRAMRESEERRQRHSAEEALQRFAAILENTPDFVGMAALDGRIFYINRAGLDMIGRAASQDAGLLTLGDLFPQPVAENLNRQILPAALRDGTWVGETTLRSQNGRLIPVSQVLIAHKADNGAPEYISTVIRDLTAVKEAERHIREQADLINMASDAIIVSDLDDRITFWNKGAERMVGWSSQEAIGRAISEVLGGGSLEGDDRSQDEWRGETALRDKDGDLLVVEKRITLIRDGSGQPRSRLIIATDITQKKKIEEQFLRAQRLESIGMLATGIAHDLNNVLAPILMAAPMLRERAAHPADLKMLINLEKSAERGAGLVRQILSFAHGVGGESRITQLKPILRDLLEVIQQTFPKNIRIEEPAIAELWPVKANPTQIHQMLLNLCLNARDAMPEGGRLAVSAENLVLDELAASGTEDARPGAYVVVKIADTGTGISSEVRERIWDPFFTTKEPTKGTGLGLSTVLGLVKEHGGFITLETEAGRGSSFSVHIPAVEVGREGPADPKPRLVPRGNGELLLVVDDEPSVREVTTAILAQHGYRVISAGDGAEAVALLAPRSSEVKLVITDMQMPHLDGPALASVVERLNPSIKLLAASGMDNARTEAGARRFAGAFLVKPFKADDLLAEVNRLLSS